MEDRTQQQLEDARMLIQNEQYDEAISILQAIVLRDRDNLQAWWLMANAVESPEDARIAVKNVLRLDPNHAGAREMLQRLDELYPPAEAEPEEVEVPEPPPTVPEPEPPDMSGLDELRETLVGAEEEVVEEPATFPEPIHHLETRREEVTQEDLGLPETVVAEEEPVSEEDFFFLQEEGEGEIGAPVEAPGPRGRGCSLSPIVGISLLVLVVLISVSCALAAMSGRLAGVPLVGALFGGDAAPAATQGVAAPPTADPDVEAVVVRYHDVVDAMGRALAGEGLAPARVEVRRTAAGLSMLGVFCVDSGPDLGRAVTTAMAAISREALPLDEPVEAVGVEISSCSRPDDTIYAVVVPLQVAIDFTNGDTDMAGFRSAWMPIH